MKKYWNRIPRPTRVILYILLILALGVLAYLLIDKPTFRPEDAFRKVEAAELVGPSRILAVVDTPDYDYPQLVIADDGDDVILCGLNPEVWNADTFSLRPKQGEVTVYCAPTNQYSPWSRYRDLQIPVVLVDSHPEAVQAKITFELAYESEYYSFREEYKLTAPRKADRVFVFDLLIPADANISSHELHAIHRFALSTGSPYRHSPNLSIPIGVELYDRSGNLIHTETVITRSPAAQYIAQHEATQP